MLWQGPKPHQHHGKNQNHANTVTRTKTMLTPWQEANYAIQGPNHAVQGPNHTTARTKTMPWQRPKPHCSKDQNHAVARTKTMPQQEPNQAVARTKTRLCKNQTMLHKDQNHAMARTKTMPGQEPSHAVARTKTTWRQGPKPCHGKDQNHANMAARIKTMPTPQQGPKPCQHCGKNQTRSWQEPNHTVQEPNHTVTRTKFKYTMDNYPTCGRLQSMRHTPQ